MTEIQNIKIKKLWGKNNYNIDIENNCLIVVGENGSGKTTILKMIFYFLTKQWDRLSEIPFESMEVTISNVTYKLNTSEISSKFTEENLKDFLNKNNPYEEQTTLDELKPMLLEENFSNINTKSKIEGIIASLGEKLSRPSVVTLFDDLYNYKYGNLIKKLTFDIPIIYLPTYRRIEIDLDKFFSQFKVVGLDNEEIESHRKKNQEAEDLDKINIRDIINNLELAYLSKYRQKSLKNIELAEFGLRDIEDALGKNLDIQKLKTFIDLCNEYLNNKKLFLKEDNLFVRLIEYDHIYPFSGEMFSSGEKQILAIYYYLILTEIKYFVIIDEPEISISLFWQKRILNDIIKSENTIGLLAATHSVQIFKDGLDQYTYSFNNFREE